MAVTNPSTANVSTTVPSATGFSINVAACNLNSNLSEKDFFILVDGNAISLTDWVKTNSTTLTYSGPNLTVGDSLVIRRQTPPNLLKLASFGSRISSAEYNDEFERRARIDYEIALNGGSGGGGGGNAPLDDAFGAGWNGDVTFAPTRNAVYDWGVGLAPLASPAFTGNPTVPTQTLTDNSTRAASTAFVQGNLGTLAPLASPAFTGNPTAPSQSLSDYSTRLANTFWVKDLLAANPAIGTNATAVTQAVTDNSTALATTAFAQLASVVRRIEHSVNTALVTATGSFADISPSIVITPRSTSSKFLCIATGPIYLSSSSTLVEESRIIYGSTVVSKNYRIGYVNASVDSISQSTILGVASPSTTSPVTFQVQGRLVSGSGTLLYGTNTASEAYYWNLTIIEFSNTI